MVPVALAAKSQTETDDHELHCSLAQKKVVLRFRVDMRDPPLIFEDLHRLLQFLNLKCLPRLGCDRSETPSSKVRRPIDRRGLIILNILFGSGLNRNQIRQSLQVPSASVALSCGTKT